jgi:glycosyltransferase involved in cell wall biosynthesis
MLGHFDEALRCYFVDDQYSLFSGVDANAALRNEEELLNQVDLVFCTSETLCQDKKRFNANVHFVANGVDYEIFAAAASNRYPCPAELRMVRRPILGFVGNLDDKVDYSLLTAIAKENPAWSLVLVGPDNIYTPANREEFVGLLTCKNVKWIGPRQFKDVPAYVQEMNVCAIPNRVNEFTRFVYPIKLHEYLAAGKAVVASPLLSLTPFEDVIHIATSAAEWGKYLDQALAETGPEQVERRQALASQHTWEHRAEKVHVLLSDALKKIGAS